MNKLDDEDKSNEIKKLLTVMEKILTILLNITYVNKDSKGTKRRKGLRESGAFYRRSWRNSWSEEYKNMKEEEKENVFPF